MVVQNLFHKISG